MSLRRAPNLVSFFLLACAADPSANGESAATAEPSLTQAGTPSASGAPGPSPTGASVVPTVPTPGSSVPVAPSSPSLGTAPVAVPTAAPTASGQGGVPVAQPEPTSMGGASGGASTNTMGGSGGTANAGAGGTLGAAGSGAAGMPDPGGAGAGTGGLAGSAGASGGGASGGAGGSAGDPPYNPCPDAGEPCRIVPFGDSITDGFNIPGGYRMELFRLALDAGQSIEFAGSSMNGPTMVDGVTFPRAHEGHSGYTIDNAPQAGRTGISPLVGTVLGFEPDIILLKIGTNDLDQNVDVDNAPARLGALLDSIFSQDEHVLVVVAQIIPSRNTQLNARVAAYNDAIPALVAERATAGQHVLVADMEAAFLADPDYQSSFLADTLHPNEAGYARLAETWYGVIGQFLR